jgi:hypothetical protein
VRRVAVLLGALAAVGVAVPAAGLAAKRPPKPVLTWVGCWPRSCGVKAPATQRGARLLIAVSKARPPLFVEFPRSGGRRVRARAGRRAATRFVVRVPSSAVTGRIRVASRGGPWSVRSRIIRIVRKPTRRTELGNSPTGTAFDGNGMWVWVLNRTEGGNLDAIVARARQHDVRTIFLKSGDGTNYWSNQFTPAIVNKLKGAGLNVCAWQYVYGKSPKPEADVAVRAIQNGADCFVIDAESEYEGRYAQAQTYTEALRAGAGANYPIALAGFPYVDYHPSFPYSVFMGPGGAQFNQPQMYWRAIGTSVDNVYAHSWPVNRVYGRPILPLGQIWQDPPPAEITRFRSLAAAYGASGVSWWDWQEASERGFTAAGATLGATPPAPAAASAYPTLKRGSKGDLVIWAQERLAGSGQALTVDGGYGPGTETAVRNFQTGQGLPVTGVIDAATWPALLRAPIAAPDWNGAAAARASAATARTGPPSARLPSRRAEIPPLGRGG